MKKKKSLIFYILLTIFTLLLIAVVWIVMGMKTSICTVYPYSGNNLGQLKKGDILEQEFPIKNNGVEYVQISFATFGERSNEGLLTIYLENESNELLAESKVDISGIADCSYQTVYFEKKVEKGDVVTARIVIEEFGDDSQLTCFVTNYDEVEYNLKYNGEILPYEITLLEDSGNIWGYRIFAVSMFLVLSVTIGITYFAYKYKHAGYEKIFLIISIGLGIIYMFLLPARTIPDEDAHIVTAYDVSNKILGTDEVSENNKIYMRYCDNAAGYVTKPNNENIMNILSGIFSMPEDSEKEMVETGYKRTVLDVPKESYIISALGITAGRVLGLNGEITLAFGRLLNYIFYVIATYYAIKRIPVGKLTLLLVAMLPMMLQQTMSYSYDALVFTLMITFVSYFVLMMKKDISLKITDIVLILISCLVLCRIKSSAYMPMVLLIAIPIIKHRKEKCIKKMIYALVGILVAVVLYKVVEIFFSTGSEAVATSDTSEYYTISYLLGNKKNTIMVFINTIWQRFDFYLYSLVGYSLSHCSIYMPSFVAVIYLFILFLGTIPAEEEEVLFNVRQKTICMVMSLISAGGIIMAMWLTFTPIPCQTIEGVQGRYFMPQLILILAVFRSEILKLKKNIAIYLIIASLLLQYFTVYSIVMYYLR